MRVEIILCLFIAAGALLGWAGAVYYSYWYACVVTAIALVMIRFETSAGPAIRYGLLTVIGVILIIVTWAVYFLVT